MTHTVAGSTMEHSNQATSGCCFIKSSTGSRLSCVCLRRIVALRLDFCSLGTTDVLTGFIQCTDCNIGSLYVWLPVKLCVANRCCMVYKVLRMSRTSGVGRNHV